MAAEIVPSFETLAPPNGRIEPPVMLANPGDVYRVLTVVDSGDRLAQLVVNATLGGDWVGDLVCQFLRQRGDA
ncbi:MAG: hypothetical protein AAF589_02965 [Planctomycetota bacterium]